MSTQYNPDQLRGHAEDSDGILEYDNKLPAWWVGLFILTIVWSVWVLIDWHLLTPRSQAAEFREELAAVAPPREVDLSTIAVVFDDASLAKGKEVFLATCASCHGPEGKGGIGVNLTDETWVHGNTVEDIRKVIATGVLTKGMPAWMSILGPEKLGHVTAYVATLDGRPRP